MNEKAARDKILIQTSWVSTIGNSLLSVSKLLIGFMFGSLAVISDGIDSATDVVISVVMIFTARIVSKPPSPQFAYGYEKAEGIAAKILSLVIFFAGLQMLISSIQNIFFVEEKNMPGVMAIYVTVFSIVGKLLLAWYQYKQGKKINSSLLKANAINMRNDVIISISVLIGLAFTFILQLPILDAITGLLVSIYVIRSAFGIFMESNIDLMDGVKDLSVYNKIIEAVEKTPGACNPHRMRSRSLGNMYMIALDVEADADISLKEAHDIAESVEENIRKAIENVYDIVVHVEPKGHSRSREKFGVNERV